METNWVTDFKENVIYRMEEDSRMIEIAIEKLRAFCGSEFMDNYLWKRPNGSSNSIGNQLLHVCGNITQYAIASLGDKPDERNRDAEFDAKEGFSTEELLANLFTTVKTAINTISISTEEQLLRKRNVQGFTFSGMGCALHAMEHYSYHTGQIAFWVKQLANTPLGFYDGLNLNELNE